MTLYKERLLISPHFVVVNREMVKQKNRDEEGRDIKHEERSS